MQKQSFLSYQELQEQLPDFAEFGCSQGVLNGFVHSKLILGYPDSKGYRYHAGDVKLMLLQRKKNSSKQTRS